MAAVLGWQKYGTRRQIPPLITPKTRVEVFEGAVEVQTADATRVLHNGERLVDSEVEEASGVAEPSPTEVQIAQATEPVHEPTGVQVRVVDALGDAMLSDATEVAGLIYNSTNGEIALPELESGPVEVVAGVAGRESEGIRIGAATDSKVDSPLEYLCSFDIEILDHAKNDAPLEGVEVIVWQGPQVVRPIPETVSLKTYDITSDYDSYGTIVIRRTSDELRVQKALKYGFGQEVNLEGWKNPAAGDVLVALSGSCWRSGDQSVFPDDHWKKTGTFQGRDRMWDSVVLYGQYAGTSYFRGTLEFERNGERFPNATYEISADLKELIAARGVTDHAGRCRFENLPPRLYFVQGRTPTRRTGIDVLTPVEKGRRLYMYTSGDQVIEIIVKKNNELFTFKKGIENAQVVLTGVGHQFHGIAKTSRHGDVQFKGAPFGNYKMTVIPPTELKSVPAAQTLEFEYEEWSKSIHVEFSVHDGYNVSGTVLREDTRESVPGFPLQLTQLGVVPRVVELISGDDGAFQLPNLAAGQYVLNGNVDARMGRELLHVPSRSGSEDGRDSLFPGLHFEVKDEDIEGLEFYLMPTVRTRLIGQVVDVEGHGVPDAYVSVSEGIPDGKVRSDENGYFELSIVTGDPQHLQEDVLLKDEVIACVGQEIPPKTTTVGQRSMSTSIMSSYGSLSIQGKIVAQGSCPVQYHAGETVEGIVVEIIDPREQGFRIMGRIADESGIFPTHLSGSNLVWAKQEGRNIHAEVNEDGTYLLKNVSPGPIEIKITPTTIRTYSSSSNGGESVVLLAPGPAYSPQIIHIMLPEAPELTTLDITLLPGARIKGRVIDDKLNPITECHIAAKAGEFYSGDRSNSSGEFLLDHLVPGTEYEIAFSLSSSDKPIKVIRMVSPTEGAVIQGAVIQCTIAE